MFIVGLTGGIGSGKSAVSDRFAALGITVVDADVVARMVVEAGTPALKKIAEHFGSQVILADGTLNRAELRRLIFQDDKQRHWLEQLTHPLIAEEIQAQLNASRSDYSLFVSPLLIETAQHSFAQRILVVDVPVELQLTRTISRDNNTGKQVQAIIDSQASRKQRLAKADDVIVNDKDLAWLDTEVQRLHKVYCQLAQGFK